MIQTPNHLLSLIQELKKIPINSVGLRLAKLPLEERVFVADQVQGFAKTQSKLPLWQKGGILFPPNLNLEQCSSQRTAELKLDLIKGKRVLDLTGGFGVDSSIFALNGFSVIHVEPNLELQKLVEHNAEVLGISEQIQFINSTAEEFLQSFSEPVNTIFIDPSRRDENQRRVVSLHDCAPNVSELLPKLFALANHIVLKLSPMLDIHQVVQELHFVDKIRVVSIKNECKELLLVLSKNGETELEIETINVLQNQVLETFTSLYSDVFYSKTCSPVLEYLYDPNASVHKAQLYSSLESAFPVFPIAPQTHIFTSTKEIPLFPGRKFRVLGVFQYKKGSINEAVRIVCKNFPDSELDIRKKLNLKQGDKNYLYAVRDENNKPICILCQPLND